MDNQSINTLFIIASIELAISGIIFLLIAIFDEGMNDWTLFPASGCVILSNSCILYGLTSTIRKINNKFQFIAVRLHIMGNNMQITKLG